MTPLFEMINYKGWKNAEGVDPVCEFPFVYAKKRISLGRERTPKKNIMRDRDDFQIVYRGRNVSYEPIIIHYLE